MSLYDNLGVGMPKLNSRLPQEHERNGLGPIGRILVDRPRRPHLVVALLDCSDTSVDHDADIVTPRARVLQIEVVQDEDRELAERLLRRAKEGRLGDVVLPFTLETEIIGAVRGVDAEDEQPELPLGDDREDEA